MLDINWKRVFLVQKLYNLKIEFFVVESTNCITLTWQSGVSLFIVLSTDLAILDETPPIFSGLQQVYSDVFVVF